MRNYPYVVVLSGFPLEADFLARVLDDLEIPRYFALSDIQPGENWSERLRAELNKADVVLVGTKLNDAELKALENIKSHRSMDPAFKIIPVVPTQERTVVAPAWLQDVTPLSYDANNPSNAISSLVKILIPHRETEPVETLDELVAEAKRLVLRLKSTEDQYRHSLILLGISSLVVFASGFMLVLGIRGAGNPLSGFYQLVGLIVLPVGSFFLLHSIVNWSSTYQRLLRSRRLIEVGSSIISDSKPLLEAAVVKTETSSRQSDTEREKD